MCLPDVSNENINLIKKNNIIIKHIKKDIPNYYNEKWDESFLKLKVFSLINYDKICWIDSDIIVLKNCDELFNLPVNEYNLASAIDNEIFPDKDTKLNKINMIQAGLFVLKPNLERYNHIIKNLGKLHSNDGSDQGYLTEYYYKLNKFENYLFLSSIYNYMKRGLKRHKQYDIRKIKCLHFVGNPKPWYGGEKGYEKLQNIYNSI